MRGAWGRRAGGHRGARGRLGGEEQPLPAPVSVCLDPAGQEHVFASVGCVCLCSLDQGEQCLSLIQSPAAPCQGPTGARVGGSPSPSLVFVFKGC